MPFRSLGLGQQAGTPVTVGPDGSVFTRGSHQSPNGQPLWPSPFGQLRVVSPYSAGNFVNRYEVDTDEFGTRTATGGSITHVPGNGQIELAVDGTDAADATLRTHRFFLYQAARAGHWYMTVTHLDAGQTNQVREWGYGDDDDGLFFRLEGTALSVLQRSTTSAGDVQVAQADWNVDTMLDGSGPSGRTLDITTDNIYECMFEYLGAGDVYWFINGWLVHIEQNSGHFTGPYMRSGQAPLQLRVLNTGTSVAGGLLFGCAAVQSEGGTDPKNKSFGDAYNDVDFTVGTSATAVLAIRPKLLYNGLTNRIVTMPMWLRIGNQSGRCRWHLRWIDPNLGDSVAGGTWIGSNTESATEFNRTMTGFTGGKVLTVGFLSGTTDFDSIDLRGIFQYDGRGRHLHLDAFGTVQPILLLTCTNESGGTCTVKASFTYEEIR